jgi:hypothetical protein
MIFIRSCVAAFAASPCPWKPPKQTITDKRFTKSATPTVLPAKLDRGRDVRVPELSLAANALPFQGTSRLDRYTHVEADALVRPMLLILICLTKLPILISVAEKDQTVNELTVWSLTRAFP